MTSPPPLPRLQPLGKVAHVGASELDCLRSCPLRFLLDRDQTLRKLQPYAASAALGIAAHATLASLLSAQRTRSEIENLTRTVAQDVFDQALARECAKRDAAIAERGRLSGDSTEAPAALPYASMTRARVTRFAAQRFGESWHWRVPTLFERGRGNAAGSHRIDEGVEPELGLRSGDGTLRGIADAVTRKGTSVLIEEFKSGESTPERLDNWKHQLLLYAYLYREQRGVLPSALRVHSLASGSYEFPCTGAEAEETAARARADLLALNSSIDRGATAEDLARPAEKTCSQCLHRPWCESYWAAAAPGSNGADLEGTVGDTNAWEASLLLRSGQSVRVNFRALRIVPSRGERLRICSARLENANSIHCVRGTSVWRAGQ